eukprot:5531602-Amphidinium_carterae.2
MVPFVASQSKLRVDSIGWVDCWSAGKSQGHDGGEVPVLKRIPSGPHRLSCCGRVFARADTTDLFSALYRAQLLGDAAGVQDL